MFKALWELVKAIIMINVFTGMCFVLTAKWALSTWYNGEDLLDGFIKRTNEFLESTCKPKTEDSE